MYKNSSDEEEEKQGENPNPLFKFGYGRGRGNKEEDTYNLGKHSVNIRVKYKNDSRESS